MKRYSYEDDTSVPGGRIAWRMIERDDGEYVKYADIQAENKRLDEIAQRTIAENVSLTLDQDELLKLLRASATQVICVDCHTLCTFDGKVCTACGSGRMIEPVRILDQKKVEELLARMDKA